MNRVKISFIVIMLVLTGGTAPQIHAQPEQRAAAENAKLEGKGPGKSTGFMKQQKMKRDPMAPKPFLMAGDPRFERMLKLALVKEDKLNEVLAQWPHTQQMSENEKRRFMRRISAFRNKIRRQAFEEARKLGLEIPEGQKVAYLKSYWTSRIELERGIREQAQQQHDEGMKSLRQELKSEWVDR